jgi:formylglycine-generating enzyme required for sulfatase activity
VDWCDAYAYCKAVGKRLCGKIGGGSNGWSEYADATKSQWFNACSAGGANVYPYGNTYEVQACNGKQHSASSVPVESMTGCESSLSGYTGVYDLSGNVWEWEDACNQSVGQFDNCLIVGGSFNDYDNDLRCDTSEPLHVRDDAGSSIGFRCCSDP